MAVSSAPSMTRVSIVRIQKKKFWKVGGVRGIILFDRGTEAYFCKLYREFKKFEFSRGEIRTPIQPTHPEPYSSWILN